MNADSDADRADLHLLGQGDDLALNRIIRRWERPLFAFAWRYVRNTADAQDLVAGLFVRLYERRASLRADSHLAGWLFTALANLCHNHHRWRRRHPVISLDRQVHLLHHLPEESRRVIRPHPLLQRRRQ